MTAAASGLVGVFALMRRMTLASDALSHVALPGLGLALLFKINPLAGAAAALAAGAVLVWLLEKRTGIPTEVIIGVFFSASLALGSLLTPQEDLLEALFGQAAAADGLLLAAGILVSAGIIAFILLAKERLLLSLISPDLARVSGVNVDRLNLWFLLAFVANVLLGLQFLGVLLMGSLIIVPAAAARNLTRGLSATLAAAAVVSILSVAAGFFISSVYELAFGPTVISVAAGLFFISLFKR